MTQRSKLPLGGLDVAAQLEFLEKPLFQAPTSARPLHAASNCQSCFTCQAVANDP